MTTSHGEHSPSNPIGQPSYEFANAPPEVRQWMMENFSAVRIDGFALDSGDVVEIVYARDTLSRFALIESLRRTIAYCDTDVKRRVELRVDEDWESKE